MESNPSNEIVKAATSSRATQPAKKKQLPDFLKQALESLKADTFDPYFFEHKHNRSASYNEIDEAVILSAVNKVKFQGIDAKVQQQVRSLLILHVHTLVFLQQKNEKEIVKKLMSKTVMKLLSNAPRILWNKSRGENDPLKGVGFDKISDLLQKILLSFDQSFIMLDNAKKKKLSQNKTDEMILRFKLQNLVNTFSPARLAKAIKESRSQAEEIISGSGLGPFDRQFVRTFYYDYLKPYEAYIKEWKNTFDKLLPSLSESFAFENIDVALCAALEPFQDAQTYMQAWLLEAAREMLFTTHINKQAKMQDCLERKYVPLFNRLMMEEKKNISTTLDQLRRVVLKEIDDGPQIPTTKKLLNQALSGSESSETTFLSEHNATIFSLSVPTVQIETPKELILRNLALQSLVVPYQVDSLFPLDHRPREYIYIPSADEVERLHQLFCQELSRTRSFSQLQALLIAAELRINCDKGFSVLTFKETPDPNWEKCMKKAAVKGFTLLQEEVKNTSALDEKLKHCQYALQSKIFSKSQAQDGGAMERKIKQFIAKIEQKKMSLVATSSASTASTSS